MLREQIYPNRSVDTNTNSGYSSSINSSKHFSQNDSLSQMNVAKKFLALLFFGSLKLSEDKKEKASYCLVFPSNPMVSARALFPLPLFPIMAIKSGFRDKSLSNQISDRLESSF